MTTHKDRKEKPPQSRKKEKVIEQDYIEFGGYYWERVLMGIMLIVGIKKFKVKNSEMIINE